MLGGKRMDMFMDKLAQKLTAQEIIKANTAADTEELNRLKNQVADYNDCLTKMQKLIEEGTAKLSGGQAVNGSEINRLVEESICKIKELGRDTAAPEEIKKALEEIKKVLEERLDAMDKNVSDRLDAMDKNVFEQVGTIDKTLSEKMDILEEKLENGSNEKLSDRMNEVEENVHKECVKVYRNVQAVVVEESGKQNTLLEEMSGAVKSFDGKLKIILGISVIAFITSLVGTILQVLSALNIHPF